MASSSSAERPYAPQGAQAWIPQQVNTPPQYLGRRTQPIKRSDSEPITRSDLQYDLLYFIFADHTPAFVDCLAPGSPLVNFCDLYVNALYNSNKCSKVLKEKMVENPAFAIEFAKISLLTNVGRINTTMAFFPEMKTALRSYHPVPSLQKTDGNLQDAPRIKNCLKAALLPDEFKSTPPNSPSEILDKVKGGNVPPTSVVNLIFVLSNANHAQWIARRHFEPPIEFLDLFLPINLDSMSRAKVFLWIMFYYLRGPNQPNPFDDDFSRQHPPKAPLMRSLSKEQMEQENIDPPEEIEWGRRMSAQRSLILKELVDEMESEKRRKKNPPVVMPPASSSMSHTAQELAAIRRVRKPAASASADSRASSRSRDHPGSIVQTASLQEHKPVIPQENVLGEGQERSMLQQAWHIVQNTDPLEDSDEDADEHVRLEYNRRLQILTRLRGKAPTPPPETTPNSVASDVAAPNQLALPSQPTPDTRREGSDPNTGGRLQQVKSWQ